MQSLNQPSDASSRSAKGRSAWALLLGLLLGGGIGLLVGTVAFADDDEALVPVEGTTLRSIVDNPDEFVGDPTVVSGQVAEIISRRAFTVSPPGLPGAELLVVSKVPVAAPTGESATRPILEGDFVHVAGDVRRLDVSTFERDLGVDLRQEFDSFAGDDLGEREGDPAIQAEAVTFLSRTTPVVEAGSAEEIAERPRDFYGVIASVDGRVTDVLPSGALVLEDEVVALTADVARGRPREGDEVRIVGPVRPFDPDQMQAEGGPLPDDEILGGLANRPAVVAQSIEVVDP